MSDIRFELPRLRPRTADRLAFRLLVALTYPLFLMAALLSRFLPIGDGLMGRSGSSLSVFAQARRTCEAAIAFAFQG